MLILLKMFTVSGLRYVWKNTRSKFLPTSAFGNIVSRKIFENILSNISFSHLSEDDDDPLTDSCWYLVGLFLKAINEHRETYVSPPDHL